MIPVFAQVAKIWNSDLSLVKELENNSGKPTLRFYKWKPFCISTGYHQKQNEINLELCKKDGIEIVTRPTGGRAILHANELTYSVVMNSNGNSVNEVYCEISKAIVKGLNILGAKVEYSKNENNLSTFYKMINHLLHVLQHHQNMKFSLKGRR